MLNFVGSKGKDLINLSKQSILILHKDKDLFIPVIYNTIVSSIGIMAAFAMAYFLIIDGSIRNAIISGMFMVLVSPVAVYLKIKHKAASCWMTYEVLQNIDTNIRSGMQSLKGKKIRLFLIALFDLFVKNAKEDREEGGFFSSFIMGILLSFLVEVWDLIKNFSLPVIVIHDCTIRELPEKLASLKENIPATLMGVLGLDIIGSIIVSAVSTIVLLGCVLGGLTGYLLPDMFPQAWLFEFNNTAINSLPVFICLLAGTIVVSFLNNLVIIVKSIYFTVFYTALHNPMAIDEGIRAEVTNYLNYNNRCGGYDFFSAIKKTVKKKIGVTDDDDLSIDTATSFSQADIKKCIRAYQINLDKGYSKEKVDTFLNKKGFSADLVAIAYDRYKNENSEQNMKHVEKLVKFIRNNSEKGVSNEKIRKYLIDKKHPENLIDRAIELS